MRGGYTHSKGCLSEMVLAEGGKEPWLGPTGEFSRGLSSIRREKCLSRQIREINLLVFRGILRGLLLALDEDARVLIGRTKGGGQGRPSRGFRPPGAGRVAFGGLVENGAN